MVAQTRTAAAAAAAAATPPAAATSTRASGIVPSDLSNLSYKGQKLADRQDFPKAYHKLRDQKGRAPATAIEFVDDFCSWYKSNNMMGSLPYKTTAEGYAKLYFEIVRRGTKNRQGINLPAKDAEAYAAAAGSRYDQYSAAWLAQVTRA